MTEQENREAFEETLSRIGKTDESTFDKHDDGSYKMDIIHFGWKMWQASANREGYKLAPLEPTKEMTDCVYGEDGNYIDSIDGSPESFYKAMINAV